MSTVHTDPGREWALLVYRAMEALEASGMSLAQATDVLEKIRRGPEGDDE